MNASTKPAFNRWELGIIVLLRLASVGGMSAAAAVLMPLSWIDACHQWLGLGSLPQGPIVSYLARSLSAFYVFIGVLVWHMSKDIRRYRELIQVLGYCVVVMGMSLTWIDLTAPLPLSWTLGEGPPTILAGIFVLYGQLRFQRAAPTPE